MKNKKVKKVIDIILTIASGTILLIFIIFVCSVFFSKRTLIDLKANLWGLDQTINVYTADGNKIIATYTGKIAIETNNGRCLQFYFDGKYYTYYNCFIEVIADT